MCVRERERELALVQHAFRFDYDLQFTGHQTPMFCKCLSPLELFQKCKDCLHTSELYNILSISYCNIAESNLSTSCEPNSVITKEVVNEFEV